MTSLSMTSPTKLLNVINKLTDITTSEWLVVTHIWTRRPSVLMCSCTCPVWPGMSKLFSARASFKTYAGCIW